MEKSELTNKKIDLYNQLALEHKGQLEVRMEATEEVAFSEEWNEANPLSPIIKQKPTGKTLLVPKLVMTRVRESEREPLANWVKYLVKQKLGEDIEVEHDVRFQQSKKK
jgi:hypothetical protein